MTAYNRDRIYNERQSSSGWDLKIATGVISQKRQNRQLFIGSASGIAASLLIAFIFIINPFSSANDPVDYVSAQVTGVYEQAYNGSMDSDPIDDAITEMVVFQ